MLIAKGESVLCQSMDCLQKLCKMLNINGMQAGIDILHGVEISHFALGKCPDLELVELVSCQKPNPSE